MLGALHENGSLGRNLFELENVTPRGKECLLPVEKNLFSLLPCLIQRFYRES